MLILFSERGSEQAVDDFSAHAAKIVSAPVLP